jgi:hypothetical protein
MPDHTATNRGSNRNRALENFSRMASPDCDPKPNNRGNASNSKHAVGPKTLTISCDSDSYSEQDRTDTESSENVTWIVYLEDDTRKTNQENTTASGQIPNPSTTDRKEKSKPAVDDRCTDRMAARKRKAIRLDFAANKRADQ